MYTKPYKAPTLVVDSVIFQIINNDLSVLLVKRQNEPFKHVHALPGGYNPAGETTKDAMSRILATKAGIQVKSLKLVEQLYTFDTVARDPRGHAVSITYMGLGKDIVPEVSKTTQTPQFFSVNNLPQLAYDHDKIIRYALERLQAKLTYTNACFALLDPLFTLSNLQKAYEAVLAHPLDKRNFRKKFLSLDLIQPTDQLYNDGPHRPARLYKFKSQTLQSLARSFD